MESLENPEIFLQENAHKQTFGHLGSLELLLTHGTLDEKHDYGAI